MGIQVGAQHSGGQKLLDLNKSKSSILSIHVSGSATFQRLGGRSDGTSRPLNMHASNVLKRKPSSSIIYKLTVQCPKALLFVALSSLASSSLVPVSQSTMNDDLSSTVCVVNASMSTKSRWIGLILIVPLFFLWGFALGILDVMNKHFQTVLGLTKLQSTGLQVATFGAYFVFPPLFGGPFIRRLGYKPGIILGLGLFVTGALMFWPAAKFLKFGIAVGATFVMACGLSELEVVANTYMAILGSPETASLRVTIAQAFNGIGFVIGPLIASHAFFSGKNSTSLTSVQYVYLGIAIAAAILAVGFVFAKLPEVSDELMLEQAISSGDAVIAARPLHKQWHTLFGWIAQFIYVASQVTISTFFLNYVTEVTSISDAVASNLLSVGLAAFTIGRFVSAGLMCFFKPRHILAVWAFMAAVLTGTTIGLRGPGAVVALIFVMGFESSMYPTIFTLSIANLGANTKKGGSFMVMAVGGGAVFPPIQGAIADAIGTAKSQCIPMIGFCMVFIYALFLAEPFGKNNEDDNLEKTVQQIDDVEEGRREDSML